MFARQSHNHSYCGALSPLLFSSNRHGEYLKERVVVSHDCGRDNPKYTSPVVLDLYLSAQFILGAKSIAQDFRILVNTIYE
jgi:hypothetical protein